MSDQQNSFVFTESQYISLKEQAYISIRDAILRGQLQPQYRLREGDVAKQMRISRGPVREAFALLEKEGLLITSPHRETRVAEISSEEISAIFVPTRLLIETNAACHAAQIMTQENFTYLESLIKDMEKACAEKDVFSLTKLDIDFHSYIVNTKESSNLTALWNIVIVKIHAQLLFRGISLPSLGMVVQEHQEYLDTLRAKNQEEIKQHLIKHIH